MNVLIRERIQESISVKSKLLENEELINTVDILAGKIAEAIRTGHKLVICGNGGSASDALHLASGCFKF